MKRVKSLIANARVMKAFFIHLHIVIMNVFRNIRKIMKNRKKLVLLKKIWNI